MQICWIFLLIHLSTSATEYSWFTDDWNEPTQPNLLLEGKSFCDFEISFDLIIL